MTLTEYCARNEREQFNRLRERIGTGYCVRDERAETNLMIPHLTANLTQGAMRYVGGDIQVYRGQEWIPVRSIAERYIEGVRGSDVNQVLSIRP